MNEERTLFYKGEGTVEDVPTLNGLGCLTCKGHKAAGQEKQSSVFNGIFVNNTRMGFATMMRTQALPQALETEPDRYLKPGMVGSL